MKRLRYSLSDEQWALIVEMAKAFSLEPKIVMQFATSIGLRFLDMSLIHPLTGLGKALDERTEQGAASVMGDLNKATSQATEAKTVIRPAEVPSQSKNIASRIKISQKRE